MTRILLLEPNTLLGSQYVNYLKQHGFKVLWSQNAQTAIMSADKEQPDIVVIELLLAGHSGIEFIHEFRSYSEWRKIPIIILSRMPREQLAIDEKALRALGVVEYLYKPDTSLQRLKQRISNVKKPIAKNV